MLFFLMRPLFLLALVALLIRAGMHAQQLADDGFSPWSSHGVEEVGERMRSDLDRLLHVVG